MKRFLCLAAIAVMFLYATSAFSQEDPETIVVTPVSTKGWLVADQRPGGNYEFTSDSTAPLGTGAIHLTTDNTTASKLQYMHEASTLLSAITSLSYSTRQISGPTEAAASFQLAVNLTGNGGFTTLVYEPYWNGVVTQGNWQDWNVSAGQFWSSRTVTCTNGTITAGAGGPPLYSISQVLAACPNAAVIGYGINVGTYNPAYSVEVDQFVFNTTTYDFELYSSPETVEDCKKGGWSTYNPPAGVFKNQGQCVASFVAQNQ